MSKAIVGAVEIGGAIGMGAVAFFDPAVLANPMYTKAMYMLAAQGIATEAGAIASSLTNNRGMNVTTRTPAGNRQIIRGQQRVGGQIVYRSTTGTGGSGGNYVYNYIVALSTHELDAGINLYLDGRQVYWKQTANPHGYRSNMGSGSVSNPPTTTVTISLGAIASITATGGSGFANVKPVDGYRVRIVGDGYGAVYYATNSGSVTSPVWTLHKVSGGTGYTHATAEIQGRYTFGGTGAADVQDPTQSGYGLGYGIGVNGAHYNFSGKVYCEMRWGDQPFGDVMQSLIDNDGAWASGPGGNSNQATAASAVNPIAGQVTAAWVVSGGGGYTGPTISISFSGGGGSGAAATGTITGGRLSSITMTSAGSGYTTPPTVNIPAPTGTGAQSSPSLCGCAYLYINVGYAPDQFPGEPEIRVTVSGKNDIYDPRTGKTGYTSNWALHVADAITDPLWGIGDSTVNQAQLIAAANICDQTILSQGGMEAQYALHMHYDTATAPGEVVTRMMDAADGRLSRIGGEWYIWPAAWQGSSFSFDESSLLESIQWNPYRSPDQLFNRITGVYTAPTYPYNVAGNLYDSNGWWNGTTQTNFNFCWQPTDYPMVAADTLHGFGTDVFVAQDGGVILPKDVPQSCCLSISQAQRVGFVKLFRNRQQGTGTLHMSMAAFQLQPMDVILFTSPTMGWVNKYLEVVGVTTHIDYDEESGAPKLSMIVQVAETDPSVYEWSPEMEMTAYDQPAFPGDLSVVVAPPTSLVLVDNATTAVVQRDGTVLPRLLATWVPPDDVYVNVGGSQQIQWQDIGAGGTPVGTNWVDAGSVSGTASHFFLDGVTDVTNIAVRVRAVRSNGAASDWVTQTLTWVGAHVLTNMYGTYPKFALTQSAVATISMAAFDASYDTNTPVHYSARTFSIPTPTVPTWYYVTITDASQTGESSPVLTAQCSTSSALVGVLGEVFVGAIQVLPAGGGTNVIGGGWPNVLTILTNLPTTWIRPVPSVPHHIGPAY